MHKGTIRVEIVAPVSAARQYAAMTHSNPKWLAVAGFLDKVDENLKKTMVA